MHHHPNTILAMHHERQHRLEVEAARDALSRSVRRRRRFRWRGSGEYDGPVLRYTFEYLN